MKVRRSTLRQREVQTFEQSSREASPAPPPNPPEGHLHQSAVTCLRGAHAGCVMRWLGGGVGGAAGAETEEEVGQQQRHA